MTDYGDIFAKAVAAELRAERARKGITLGQLVEETGIAQSTVQRYLNGKRDIPVPALMDLCRALGVSAGSIFDAAQNSIEND